MIKIRLAGSPDCGAIREFYNELIDAIAHMTYKPGWKRDLYPAEDFLRRCIERGQMYIGELDGRMAACMAVNQEHNPEYDSVQWGVEAEDSELLVVHALGVHPGLFGRGIAGQMIQGVIDLARREHLKSVRLDVLEGNLPAEKAYLKAGFVYRGTVRMFYPDTGWKKFKLLEYIV